MLCWVQFLLNHFGIFLDVQRLTDTHVQPKATSCHWPVTAGKVRYIRKTWI